MSRVVFCTQILLTRQVHRWISATATVSLLRQTLRMSSEVTSLLTHFVENELSPAAGWEYLQNLPPIGADQDTETGLEPEEINLGNSEGTTRYVMPKLYSVQLPTYTPWQFSNSQGRLVTRTLYVQYAPNSTFATVQHVPIALALCSASYQFDEYVTQYLNDRPGADVASIEMPQAYASAFCELNSIMGENDTRPIQFPDSYVAGCGDECYDYNLLNRAGVTNYTAITRRQIWDQAKNHPQGRILWVDGIKISS